MKFKDLIEMIGNNYNKDVEVTNKLPDSEKVLKIKKELAQQQEKEAKDAADAAKKKAVEAQNKQNNFNTKLGKQ